MTRAIVAALVLFAPFGCAQQTSQLSMLLQHGVKDCADHNYAVAKEIFEQAVKADPASVDALRYLATVNFLMYAPGNTSPGNLAASQQAEANFIRVLDLAPGDKNSLAALGSLAIETQKPDEAKKWLEKLAASDPQNPDAWYALGFVAWQKAYPQLVEARAKARMKPESPGPIANPQVRASLKARIGPLLDSAIENFNHVLKIASRLSSAMQYLELCIRERADMADTRADYVRAMKEADGWGQKHMETRDDSDSGDVPPCTAMSMGNLLAPPPPPPPPPPGIVPRKFDNGGS